jgi:hypothetical protein
MNRPSANLSGRPNPDLKTAGRESRAFESHPLRQDFPHGHPGGDRGRLGGPQRLAGANARRRLRLRGHPDVVCGLHARRSDVAPKVRLQGDRAQGRRVLIAGRYITKDSVTNTAELQDPAAGTFSCAALALESE